MLSSPGMAKPSNASGLLDSGGKVGTASSAGGSGWRDTRTTPPRNGTSAQAVGCPARNSSPIVTERARAPKSDGLQAPVKYACTSHALFRTTP